jgi:glycosyltransferase involved in cell wall biosynthesis
MRDLLSMSAAVAHEKFGVFFFSSVYSYFPLLRPVPMLLGIHDTMADRHPEFAFASRREHRFWNWKVRLAMAQARMVMTVSDYSRRSIMDQFGIASSKIRVVTEAAAAHFAPIAASLPDESYVLYVGGLSPNKNLLRLVRAFSRLPKRIPRVRLILAGDFQSDGFKSNYEDLIREIDQLKLAQEVVFPGYVTEEWLRALYSGAAVFAFPSLEEGFGLPAIEAMACGAPIVASRGHALEEVVGDAGILVDPHNEEEIAAALERVLADPALAHDLRQRSLRRAADFSWDRTAEQLIDIFQEMAGKR